MLSGFTFSVLRCAQALDRQGDHFLLEFPLQEQSNFLIATHCCNNASGKDQRTTFSCC
jgi:hypothetical protein